MPDSEAKKTPAKKVTKKAATKKPAKKATKKTTSKSARSRSRGKALETPKLSDTGNNALGETPPARQDLTPDEADSLGESALDQVAATLSENLRKITDDAQRSGVPVLLGSSTVLLVMDFDDAVTPLESVHQFIDVVNRQGLDNLSYVVRDDLAGDSYIVQSGEAVKLEAEDDGQG